MARWCCEESRDGVVALGKTSCVGCELKELVSGVLGIREWRTCFFLHELQSAFPHLRHLPWLKVAEGHMPAELGFKQPFREYISNS